MRPILNGIEIIKKLNILSGITRYDILNQLTALLGYQELAQEMCNDPELLEII